MTNSELPLAHAKPHRVYTQGVCLTVARGECISSRASGTPVTTSPAGE